MLKYFPIQFFFVLVILLFGCEKDIVDANLPYEEILVIRGLVQAGDIIDSLYVGRTLPYEEYSSGNGQELESYVKDAIVTITDGIQVYPMRYIRGGYYKNDSLIAQTGTTYRLHIEWKGKTADANTTVPETPVLDSVNAVSKVINTYEYGGIETEYTSHGYCRTRKNDVFSFTTVIEMTYSYPYPRPTTHTGIYGYDNVVAKRIQADVSVTDVLTSTIRNSVSVSEGTTILSKRIVCTLKSYDEAYYKYYLTFGSDNGDGDVSVEPTPVAWNVTGNAIGMFIGVSKSVTKTYNLP